MVTFLPRPHCCQLFSVAIKRAISKPVPSTAKWVPRRPMSTAVGKGVDLPDGRRLGYHEFGEPTGTPVIYIHGTPDSGVTLAGFEDPLAKRLGVRWIAPDRPGIGHSTFYPHRKVLDYPADLKALIQHLGLPNYRIIGTSGGTGYTLACAQALPREELLAVGICAGVGPWEAGQAGQSEIIQKLVISAVRVFRQAYARGGAGHGLEMKLNTEPWGFNIEDIDYKGIRLWYGSADENTSPGMGQYMAKRLPKAVYKEYPGETHYSIWREELLTEFLKDLID
ncbi:Alpha/Beta hydrolase protein [Fusarium redolens]|uniref:Alpha/Beta hydrolase protein n=1 Tax=Fusarium redolens TaxID=48865 RepID=A0A9P9GDW1_FUSRE|nr:Alpha/Beta hydrolase protein [Fusarium redolens]KAH7236765.1 Alpha/Beta hydrolase protein [Fusarium redolens]